MCSGSLPFQADGHRFARIEDLVVSSQLQEEEIEEDGLEGEGEPKEGNPKDIHPGEHQKGCDMQPIRACMHRIVQCMGCHACQNNGGHQATCSQSKAVRSIQIVG